MVRDPSGKEVRFPVLLTAHEKDVARRISLAFGQMVNGFDILRAHGASYVCDVNGWSFVKSSSAYYQARAGCPPPPSSRLLPPRLLPPHASLPLAPLLAPPGRGRRPPSHGAARDLW